jgi:hypothetical protein
VPISLALAAAGAVLGILGGLLWSAVAPRAVFQVASRGVAYVVNPETHAFIAADGAYALIAVVGGALLGLAAYLLGVRRFGPLPVAGALIGATAAAFLAEWTGHQPGLAAFRHALLTDKAGVLLRQPLELGARGALAFWPLAAGIVIGGIELMRSLRERRRAALVADPAGSLRYGPSRYGDTRAGDTRAGDSRYGDTRYGEPPPAHPYPDGSPPPHPYPDA